MDKILSLLFPVTLPKVELEPPSKAQHSPDAFETPLVEDGILWRAYDVRRTGIERMQQEGGQ